MTDPTLIFMSVLGSLIASFIYLRLLWCAGTALMALTRYLRRRA